METFVKGRITGHPRNPDTPVAKEDDKSASILPASGSSALAESKQRRNSPHSWGLRWFCVVLILGLVTPSSGLYEHQPWEWVLVRWEDQKILQKIVTPGPPSFRAYLCDLAPITPCLNQVMYYMCPSSNPGKSHCDVPSQYYCSHWGCETIASGWKVAKSDPFLRTSWGPTGCTPWKTDWSGGLVCHGKWCGCQYIFLNVTDENDLGWTIGRAWGLRYWEPGADRGGLFFIKKQEAKSGAAIGPDVVTKNDNQHSKESLPISTPVPTGPLATEQIVPSSGPNVNPLPDKPFLTAVRPSAGGTHQGKEPPCSKSEARACVSGMPPWQTGMALFVQNPSWVLYHPEEEMYCRWGEADGRSDSDAAWFGSSRHGHGSDLPGDPAARPVSATNRRRRRPAKNGKIHDLSGTIPLLALRSCLAKQTGD